MRERVTSNDVAKHAGVSQATVSRVINNYPYIRQSTRDKVLHAIEEMGFTPDQVARSLNKRKTATIGLIVGDIANSFFAETAKVIISEARERGYDVILSNTDHESLNLEKSIDTLVGKRVEGIIVGSVERFDDEIHKLYKADFPVVLYNTKVDDNTGHSVVLNNVKGAAMAVEHLIHLNHRRIAYLTLPLKHSTMNDRMKGYKEALDHHHISFDADIVLTGEFSRFSTAQFMDRVMQSPDPPTAVFAASDQLAVSVMEYCRTNTIRVPEDLSIIGFDDIALSASPFINLTTISQQHIRMSSTAVMKLAALMEGTAGKQQLSDQIMLEPELIVRGTTADRKN
ncbi:LacI family DNA-binding transcriptional regulator [Salibacterium sp. K-3]